MADKIDQDLIKTDLYDAVNGEWLKKQPPYRVTN